MRIERLELRDFRRHVALTLELAAGLNVIRGPNEAGKSTIQRALEMVLFRRPNSTAAEIDDVSRWGSAEPPSVSLQFVEAGQRGRLTKVFAGSRGTVELAIGDELLTDPAAVDARVAALTGMPSEKFLRATASVRHGELIGLRQDETTLRERLQQPMSGTPAGTAAARRKLEDAIRRYTSQGVKNPGRLKQLRADVERLEALLAEQERALARLEADRRALTEARRRLAEAETELAGAKGQLSDAERAAALGQRHADAERRYGLYRRAAELDAEIAALEAAPPAEMRLAELRASVDRARALERELSDLRARLAIQYPAGHDRRPAPSTERSAARRGRTARAVASAALLAGALIGAAGLAVGLGGPVPAAWTWPAVAIGGLLVLIGAAWLAVGGGAGRTRRAAADELAELENVRRLAARADREERIAQVEREQAELLGRLGLALPAAEALLERASGHAARLDTLRAEQRGLVSRLGGEAPAEADDINALRDRAAAEIDECRHALAGMGELGRQPEQRLAALRAQIERATVERDSGRDAVARAEERLAANEVDAEQVAATAEALTGARTALAAGERRLRIYSEALNALNVAEQRTMKAAARFLEQHMAADVARISGGRYSQLRIDETSLAFSLFSAEAGEWIEARRLSRGTVDQLYLCARLGIVRQITGTARPPLILDDPFVTFDARRARRALELLRDVARDHQVLLLTCADRYDDLAEQVTVLPPPDTAASTPAPKAIAPAPAAPAPAPAEERATQLPLMTEVV